MRKKQMKRILLLLLLLLVLPVYTGQGQEGGEGETAEEESPGFVGLDIVFLVDQSGSMGGEQAGCTICNYANDPQGLRFYGPEYAIGFLGGDILHIHDTADVQTAVVNFGSLNTDIGLDVTTINPRTEEEWAEEWRVIQQQLEQNRFKWSGANMDGTDHKMAFDAAERILDEMARRKEGEQGERVKAIVLLTDGGPCPAACRRSSSGWLPDQMREYLQELQADFQFKFPGDEVKLLVIAMQDPLDDYWPDTGDVWNEIADGNAFLVEDDKEVASRFADFIIPLTEELKSEGVLAPVDDVISPGFYDVRPYLRQISFTFFKDSAAPLPLVIEENNQRLDLSSENPRVRLSDPAAPIQNVTILGPLPGRWRIQTEDGSEPIIRVRGIFFDRDLRQALGEPDQFYPVPIRVALLDRLTGNPPPDYSDLDPKYSLDAKATIKWSGGEEAIDLSKIDDGEYDGNFIPRGSGEHTLFLDVSTKNPDNTILQLVDEEIARFNVRPVGPRANIPADDYYEDVPVPFSFAVINEDEDILSAPAGYPWTAEAFSIDPKDRESPIELTRQGDGAYIGQFLPEDEGEYRVRFVVTGQDSNHAPITIVDQVLASVDVLPTTTFEFSIVEPIQNMEHVTRDGMAWLDWAGPFGGAVPFEVVVQLVDEAGNPINAADVGPNNDQPFRVNLRGPEGAGEEIILAEGDEIGEYRAMINILEPLGKWTLTVQPDFNLDPDFVYTPEPKSVSYTLVDNPNVQTFGTIWPILLTILIVLIIIMIVRRLLQARNSLKGTISVEDEYGVPVPGATWHLSGMRRNTIVLKGRKLPPATELSRLEIKNTPGMEGSINVKVTLRDGVVYNQSLQDGSKAEIVPGQLYLTYQGHAVTSEYSAY